MTPEEIDRKLIEPSFIITICVFVSIACGWVISLEPPQGIALSSGVAILVCVGAFAVNVVEIAKIAMDVRVEGQQDRDRRLHAAGYRDRILEEQRLEEGAENEPAYMEEWLEKHQGD